MAFCCLTILCFKYPTTTHDSVKCRLVNYVIVSLFNHFSIIFLHGATRSKHDPDCKLGNLYSVRGAEEFSIKKGKLQKADNKISFRKGMAQFVEHDFCGWYSWWLGKVSSDADVIDAKSEYDIEPIFDPTKHLNVAFAKATQQDSLRNICLERSEKVGKSNNKRWKKHDIHAASLDGHLLSMIQQCGRKDNIGVTLAIKTHLDLRIHLPRSRLHWARLFTILFWLL